jgi:hypothetical protein
MEDRDRFQLYLLSKMRARELVDDALAGLGSSREQMSDVAAHLAATHGFDDVAHPADAYAELLGAAETERALGPDETDGEFAGSKQRLYALPIWPAVRFAVNRHPDGYAWGVGFEQGQESEASLAATPETVRPWRYTAGVLLPLADAVQVIDEWSDSLEADLTLRANGCTRTWRAAFDLRLLQSWRHL